MVDSEVWWWICGGGGSVRGKVLVVRLCGGGVVVSGGFRDPLIFVPPLVSFYYGDERMLLVTRGRLFMV